MKPWFSGTLRFQIHSIMLCHSDAWHGNSCTCVYLFYVSVNIKKYIRPIHIPMWINYSPIGCLPRWRIGKCCPHSVGTGKMKCSGWNEVTFAALKGDIDLKARRRRSLPQINWSSRLGARLWTSHSVFGKTTKIAKILNTLAWSRNYYDLSYGRKL